MLEQGLAASDDQSVPGFGGGAQGLGDFFGRESHKVLFLQILAAILVGPRRALPVPSEWGVAPRAMEIAKGEPKKNCRAPEGGAFALESAKDFGGAIRQARNFHRDHLRLTKAVAVVKERLRKGKAKFLSEVVGIIRRNEVISRKAR